MQDQVWHCLYHDHEAMTDHYLLLSGPDFFWLLLAGQTFGSLTNAFEWSAPSLLASVWFPHSERASASALLGAIAPNVRNAHKCHKCQFSVFTSHFRLVY